MEPPPWPRPHPAQLGLVRVIRSGTLQPATGRLQEHIVQRRPRDRDRADLDVGGVEPPDDLGDRSGAIVDEERQCVLLRRSRDRAPGARRSPAACARRRRRGARPRPRPCRSRPSGSRASPAATISPASMIASRSQSSSASSRYWVVRKIVVPRRVDAPHLLPDRQPRGRIEAGGRLVEKEHLRLVNEGARQVEPPLHPSRVGLGPPVGGIGQARPARAAPRPGHVPRHP